MPPATPSTSAKPGSFCRDRLHAPSRGRLWSAIGVALAAAGGAPPGPNLPNADTDALRVDKSLGPPLNLTLSSLRAGTPGGPRLVLVHGTPGSADAWRDYLLNPPPGMEVVALDRPGFGRSGPSGALTGLKEQAAAVASLLPRDGRLVVLLGHSLGGPIVAQVAADHPQQVTALVLLAASLDPAQEVIQTIQYVGAWPLLRSLLPRAIRNANAELMALKPELEALALRLPSIKAKVVIVHGTQDDLVPVANVPFMQGKLTGAACVKTVLLDGQNHFLPWNSADTVRAAVAQALEPGC